MKKLIVIVISFMMLASATKAQNVYLLNNRFDKEKFDTLYKKITDSSYSSTPKKIAKSLKGYISKLSEDRDTFFIKFWPIIKSTDSKMGVDTVVNSVDNGATFAYKIKWEKGLYIKVPFSATALTATSIPFRYRLKAGSDLDAEFLNVGVNLFYIKGVTKFFKQEQIDKRQNYWGLGPFIAFSQQKIDSATTNGKVKEEKQVAAISYGVSAIKSWNGFSVIFAFGFENAIGAKAKYWENNNFLHGLKPWIGFGFGFKLTELTFNATNKAE